MSDNLERDEFTSQLVAVQRRLYSYILTLVPSLVDADDVLQESNSVLLRKRNEYTPGTEFGAWACRVAYFEVLSYRRRKSRERGHVLFANDALLDDLAGEATQRYSDDTTVPIARLEHCMGKLDPMHRELSPTALSQETVVRSNRRDMGRSPSAIRQMLYRIRTQLLTCIQREQRKEDQP